MLATDPTAKVKKVSFSAISIDKRLDANPTPQLVDVNILGSYFVAREAAKVMKPGSSIILIGSMSGVVINVPQPQTPYNFSSTSRVKV
jgi:hypothetical protein